MKMKIGWKRPAVALGAAAVCILLAGMLLVILREKGKTEMEMGIYFKKETGNRGSVCSENGVGWLLHVLHFGSKWFLLLEVGGSGELVRQRDVLCKAA